jgi:hypothetical protein
MSKIKILATQLFYPVSIGRHILEEFAAREDVELKTIGPSYGSWIPWNGGMNLPAKYTFNPDIALPPTNMNHLPIGVAEARLGDWQPDVVLQLDAGWHFTGRPKHGLNVHYLSDPHALRSFYDSVAGDFDLTWCSQTPYINPGEVYMPYAYSDKWFYPEPLDKIYDACLVGIPYGQRVGLANALKREGINVFLGQGIVFDDYRKIYNQSKVALSWSSLQDTPMRVYEAMGMIRPLIANRTPDLMNQFDDGYDFRGFDTVEEAVVQVAIALSGPESTQAIAWNGYEKVRPEYTWKKRVQDMMDQIKEKI